MSPEQIRGDELDQRSDIFSLGLVLYEMATGHKAFGGGTGGTIIEAILTRPPVSVRSINPDIPPRLEQIVDKALHKDRDQRYQGAANLLADLQQLQRNTDFNRTDRKVDTGSVPIKTLSPAPSTEKRSSQTSTVRTKSLRLARPPKVIGSLAVFPFENVSRDSENEYLSDGIPGSLINTWQRYPGCG
jgi:eukaryotic-like serine/threonine-protein kinase